MVKKYHELPAGTKFLDTLSPGLGSDRGFDMHHQKRQTKALEVIAKDHALKRVTQEVTVRDSGISSPQTFNMDYTPTAVIEGFRDMTTAQYESAHMVSSAIGNVESEVSRVVDATYQVDSSIQSQTQEITSGFNSMQRDLWSVEGSIDRQTKHMKEGFKAVDESIQIQTQTISRGFSAVTSKLGVINDTTRKVGEIVRDGFDGISRMSIEQVIAKTDITKEEIIGLLMKGILNFYQVKSIYTPHQQDLLQYMLNPTEENRKRFLEKDEYHEYEEKFNDIDYIKLKAGEFMKNVNYYAEAPVDINTLRIFARSGYLDRFAKDELGENIREVRTGSLGHNQNLRELLEQGDKSIEQRNESLAQGREEISQRNTIINQGERALSLQKKQRNIQLTQLMLQRRAIDVLERIEDEIITGNTFLDSINKTGVDILETLESIDDKIQDQTENWLSYRRDEILGQVPDYLRAGVPDELILAMNEAKKVAGNDPRLYFFSGMGQMLNGEAFFAELEFKKGLRFAENIERFKNLKELIQKSYTYLAYIYFQVAKDAQELGDKEIYQNNLDETGNCTMKAYQTIDLAETVINRSLYLEEAENMNSVRIFVRFAILRNPYIADEIIDFPLFASFKDDIMKWKRRGDARKQLL